MNNSCQWFAQRKHRVGGRRRAARAPRFERFEDRRLLSADWQNPVNFLDMDNSGLVDPQDALLAMNDLDGGGSRLLPAVTGDNEPPPYLDVTGDGWVSPFDALWVINALNENSGPMVVAAHLNPDSDPNGNGVVLRPQVTTRGQTLPRATVRPKRSWPR